MDEILKRAETRVMEEQTTAHSELLGQFKVADFGNYVEPDWDR